MTRVVGFVLLLCFASLSGCAYITSVFHGKEADVPQPPAATPGIPAEAPPLPGPETPRPAPPAGQPAVAPPRPRPAPPQQPLPPLQMHRPDADQERIHNQTTRQIAEAERAVQAVRTDRLQPDQQETFASIQSFLRQAREALAARDYERAETLARKAHALAQDLPSASH